MAVHDVVPRGAVYRLIGSVSGAEEAYRQTTATATFTSFRRSWTRGRGGVGGGGDVGGGGIRGGGHVRHERSMITSYLRRRRIGAACAIRNGQISTHRLSVAILDLKEKFSQKTT